MPGVELARLALEKSMNNGRKTSLVRKLLAELKSKHDVPDASLKLVLDEESWQRLQKTIGLVENYKHNPPPPITDQIRCDLRAYLEKLAEADRLEIRADHTSTNTAPSSNTKRRHRMRGHATSGFISSQTILRARAEAMYESALETLSELNGQYGFDVFMDRPLCFDGVSIDVLTPDAAGVPRLRDSRSQYNLYERPPRMSVRRLKIEALVSRLAQLAYMR